ncbi:MAG: leucine--tRNA ligase, partial [Anaerolineae bacterium]|nr:leucine--tRNA ligase [Phycisphaerae bacterium]
PPDANVAATERASDVDEDYDEDLAITVFTTRPDTLFGATYMVLAPEHPLVDRITPAARRESVEAYRTMVGSKSERDRMSEGKDKTGVFVGAYAINPANDARIPIYIADYVLMGYGTGAIMAVPGQDERDWDFAKKFDLPIIRTVQPPESFKDDKAFLGDGPAINSGFLNGLNVDDAKEKIIAHLEREGDGVRSTKYKLRDWLFSRQRYWGEPFPILLDEQGNPHALREDELPLVLPELADFKPTGTPNPPLSKAGDWLKVERDGKTYTRETNVMPQWAGSCWYYLRYADPKNANRFVDPMKERYWMPVDLYVGGVEHAVLHLLYARFWHKVLFDLGHVSTAEPFMKLVNQGLILGEVEYHTAEDPPRIVRDDEVERGTDGYRLKSNPSMRVTGESFKMSKSRGNVINPEDIVRDYGVDTFRLYEMYMGPLEAQKPWNTRDIVGMSRFLNAVWRNFVGDDEDPNNREEKRRPAVRIEHGAIPEPLDRMMHRTIKKVGEDIEHLHFNTGIAELIKLNNEVTGSTVVARELAETFVLLLAPFAPHIAEEIWSRLGHTKSLSRRPWPVFDPAKLEESTMELPVQINGKLRDKITVASDADESSILSTAEKSEKVQPWLAGKSIKKRLYVPKKLVNIVVG